MSKALRAFAETGARAVELAKVYSTRGQAGAPSDTVADDCVRSAVVLAAAAMDTYFTRKFSEVLVTVLKTQSPSKKLVALLHEAGLDTEQALIMLGMDRPYRRVRSLVRAHLLRYTTQHFAKIDELFACLGISNLSTHAQARAKRKMLLSSVRILVERRNAIVHDGDLNNHGRLQKVDAGKMVQRIQHLTIFVVMCDFIVENATKKKSGRKRISAAATA